MYAIKAVAMKTGLTTHTIRVWERRYDIIQPIRTETNRRLYSEEDVHKLKLLHEATQAGHSIGQLAKLPLEEIEQFVNEIKAGSAPPALINTEEKPPEYFVDAALSATENFDNEGLDNILTQASVNFSQPVLIDHVIIPFLHQLGTKWFEGKVRIAQEHVASAVVRTFLGRMLNSIREIEQGPTLITATVSGLHHEFGAMLVAISAATQGWRSHYLGANLPAEEIAFSAQKMNASALVISIVYPPHDDLIREQLQMIRRLLPADIPILTGGQAAPSYSDTLEQLNVPIANDMTELREHLVALRNKIKDSALQTTARSGVVDL
jgi:DNA-binding transcriptional MerR regulator/methylmalonyl-CoA mutase cobalamin-binding subunit